ncbi:hypothetical protein AAT17_10780 [Nonlabens sp. MIC269]|uniref:hypothetical protein n=1 Tax=Nonlabens sp. MIC269 TaxID=1476901 RepID=UPI000721A518|nr:hypothetical protein [Nonlabens sp. MIC269]ALM21682.1 hypothetical protein AAT17_10780 [Nonlabens sp. MIC269]
MKKERILEIINYFENKYPVDKWVYRGIDMWPILRIYLYYNLTSISANKSIVSNEELKKNHFDCKKIKPSFFGKTLRKISSLLRILKFLYDRRVNYIFFGADSHRFWENGRYANKFFEPLISRSSIEAESVILEYDGYTNRNRYSETVVNVVDFSDMFVRLIRLFKKEKINYSFKDYNLFLNELESIFGDRLSFFSRNDLQLIVEKVYLKYKFYHLYFKNVKPKVVFYLCYYANNDVFASLAAANMLQIKTIEIQHGPITYPHPAYSQWFSIKNNAHNTLPSNFWCWDKYSENEIKKWSSGTIINTKVVGNFSLISQRHKYSNLKKDNSYFLYSLQTYPYRINDFFPTSIINLIKQLEVPWIIRLHPRDNIGKEVYDKFFERNQLTNLIEIHDAKNVPLMMDLSRTKLHFTNYSGTVLEALELNIPTVILSETGANFFKDLLDEEIIKYINSNDSNFIERVNEFYLSLPNIQLSNEVKEIVDVRIL